MPGILRDFLFIIFMVSIFAIFGTNQFMGQNYQFCRSQEDAIFDGEEFVTWPKSGEADNEIALCKTDVQCAELFPDDDVAICGAVYEKYGVDPVVHDNIRDIELIMYGIPGFNNVAQSLLTIFQTLTLESWVLLMYNYGDAGSEYISVTFFILLVFIGTFFTMNLVIASIVEAYQEVNEKVNSAERERVEDEEVLALLIKHKELTGSLKV